MDFDRGFAVDIGVAMFVTAALPPPGAVRLGLTGYSSKILGGRASDPAQPLN
jgi:hypothetical protein